MSYTGILAFVPGGPEALIIIFLLVILFLGPKKIPELARSTGEATKEWKKGREEIEEELENNNDDDDSKTQTEPVKETET